MADIADIANDVTEMRLQFALDCIPALATGPSAEFCVDCDDAIPEPRRMAVLGCTTCIDCQSFRERR